MGIKLYGMALSNYYNIVKAVLIEKGILFEEVLVKPRGRISSQESNGEGPLYRN